MLIICKNKDYYDFLQKVYGRDNKIVYDRRDCVIMTQSSLLDLSLHRTIKNYKLDSWVEKKNNSFVLLEIGNTDYLFYLEAMTSKVTETTWRYTEDTMCLIKKFENTRLINSAPISLTDVGINFGIVSKLKNNKEVNVQVGDVLLLKDKQIINNPILKKTKIAGLINAEEVWINLYNYLSYEKRDKENDKRTNREHIESHGFDYKESFRK